MVFDIAPELATSKSHALRIEKYNNWWNSYEAKIEGRWVAARVRDYQKKLFGDNYE